MILTSRDIKLIKDIGLSHLLSRDQVIQLGYFTSVTRANTRLRQLCNAKFLKRLETPFLGQSLYMAGSLAGEVAGSNVGQLLESRTGSPRFVRHALSITNVRIVLLKRGGLDWRFEQQLWRKVEGHEIRPDGLLLTRSQPTFVEVDLGHVAPAKFKEKLHGYAALGTHTKSLYGFEHFRLLTITTGQLRSRHLRRLLPENAGFDFMVKTFEEIGCPQIGNWS